MQLASSVQYCTEAVVIPAQVWAQRAPARSGGANGLRIQIKRLNMSRTHGNCVVQCSTVWKNPARIVPAKNHFQWPPLDFLGGCIGGGACPTDALCCCCNSLPVRLAADPCPAVTVLADLHASRRDDLSSLGALLQLARFKEHDVSGVVCNKNIIHQTRAFHITHLRDSALELCCSETEAAAL